MATIKKISGLGAYTPTDQNNANMYIAVENTSASSNSILKMRLTELPKTHQHSKDLGEITIANGSWSNKSQTISCAGADYSHGVVLVTPSTRTDANNWCDYGVYIDTTYSTNDYVKFTYDVSTAPPNIKVRVFQVG